VTAYALSFHFAMLCYLELLGMASRAPAPFFCLQRRWLKPLERRQPFNGKTFGCKMGDG
jgi:hypothetical protein